MRRLVPLLVLLALVAAACGTAADSATEGGQSSTTAPATDAMPSDDSGTTSDRPTAPDFELTLGDGSVYRLADETQPVYLVFWAEW